MHLIILLIPHHNVHLRLKSKNSTETIPFSFGGYYNKVNIVGDKFYLKIHGKIRAYRVDKMRTVLPSKMLPYLQATAGKNYATLVTCVPLFINTHRLLVRGHRIPYHEEKIVRNSLSPFAWALIITVAILALVLLLHWWSKRKIKKRHQIRN